MTTAQITVAIAFLANLVRSTELRCSVTKTMVTRFADLPSSGDTIVRVRGGKGSATLAQFEAMREFGLVSRECVRADDETVWAYSVTPEGRTFKARFFGAVYGEHADLGEFCVGQRALMSF